MVSRYGVSKEGAVGVAVGVGPMHCLLPHCGGPHHHHHLSAPHPQNPQPGHNHHVHPGHQPPPSPSPHLNHQLSHHQLTVNINHLGHQQQQQQQQTQHQQAPPQYRVVTANARSDFHVPGQNYGAQPGGQVGGGGGSVGVPGGRGPPPLGGIQSIGQSPAGIPPGGPTGGQAPPPAPAPGVQSQQPQGPAPTTTPPVHTPSPQEMGKQPHLQTQPPLQQVYVQTQTRQSSQGYYQSGPRPQQPRNISHRGGQGGSGSQVVGMPGVGGGGGQPTAMYPHPAGLPVQPGTMYVQNQVPGLHAAPHQQSVYPMNNQIPMQFSAPPQRHQTHQGQSFYQAFQPHTLLTPNMFGYAPGPAGPQHGYFFASHTTSISLSRASASAVTGGTQHVGGPLAGAQGATVVPQGTLQQPTQQPQPLPPMAIPLSQTDVYSGHNGGATNSTNSTTRSHKKPRGQNAITDIVDPSTGKNISDEIYEDNAAPQQRAESPPSQPQQDSNAELIVADFAARVAKAATEESVSGSPVPANAPETSASQNAATQSLSNVQTNSTNDANSQCNTDLPAPTQNIPNVSPALCSQALGTSNNMAQIDSCPVKTESKPLQFPVKEFQPRSEVKNVVVEEPPPSTPPSSVAVVNKDNIPAQPTATTLTATTPEPEAKTAAAVVGVSSSNVVQTPSPSPSMIPLASATTATVPEVPKPSATAPSANPLPAREPFPNLSKTSSSSPPRRKSQIHPHNQPAASTELSSSAKEQQKERKTREKSLSSRGTTPTPVHNQQTDHHHQKANGDATGEKAEEVPRNEIQQKSSDGKAVQKQKSKNRLKLRELNRKGAEKEGTDMDAFVNTLPPTAKTEVKQQPQQSQQPQQPSSQQHAQQQQSQPAQPQAQAQSQQQSPLQQQQPQSQTQTQSQSQTQSQLQQQSQLQPTLQSLTPQPQPQLQPQPQPQPQPQAQQPQAQSQQPQPQQQQQMQPQVQPQPQPQSQSQSQSPSQSQSQPQQSQLQPAVQSQSQPPSQSQPQLPVQPQSQSQSLPQQQQQAQPLDDKEAAPAVSKDSNKEPIKEITKDIKGKDSHESKKEKEILSPDTEVEKHIIADAPKESIPTQAPVIDKLPSSKEMLKDISPKIEDSSKSQNACNMQARPVPNDVVDHAKMKEEMDLEAIVAQKNEENSKVSALRAPTEEKSASTPVIEKQYENEDSVQTETTPKASLSLKYTYKEDQWSPINKSGKKIYDRDFLMKLQDDPSSKVKPSIFPDLEMILKDSIKTRSTMDIRPFKDANMGRHDALFPGFVKPILNPRVAPVSRKSHPSGKPKASKPNIHVSLSLREDVKLRETENAWRPSRMKQGALTEEEAKTEALYKRVRSVLNKLTPQKFNTLVEQVRSLTIDTIERLQGVINLVFEKAVDEPSFSVAYALMCKELSSMKAMESDKQDGSATFRKLIITRCQMEFEKNPMNEGTKAAKLREIDECADPEKKKDLQVALEEGERRVRVKSVGNIRFIGELYKQGMLTGKIMHRCIAALLNQNDEESLECLCKLLTTIGKDLELKETSDCPEYMQEYFDKMQEIVSRKGNTKISSRIRFMLQDVIDLRSSKWVPRRDVSNPKTIDEIQKEAESERLDTQLNNIPMNMLRKDDRNTDRKRNRGVGSIDEGGWSLPVGKGRQTYSVETSKLKNKPPPMDDLQLGSRIMYVWKNLPIGSSKTINSNKFACLENISNLDPDKRMSPLQLPGSRSTGPREYGRDYKSSYDGRSSRNGNHQLGGSSSGESSLLDSSQSQNAPRIQLPLKSISQTTSSSHKSPLSEENFMKTLNSVLKAYFKSAIVEAAAVDIQQHFDITSYTKFVRESINNVLEKSPNERERISQLMSHLIGRNILPLQCFKAGFGEVLEIVDDLIIDIPKIWTYLAEILAYPIEDETIPLCEMKDTFTSVRSQGYVGKFLGELLAKVSRNKGSKWIADKWDQSGLQLSSLIDSERENIDQIIAEYNLEFLIGNYNSAKSSTGNQLSLSQIHDHLRRLMKENDFDEICNWIIVNVGNRAKDPKFLRVLMTTTLETSIELVNDTWKLKTDTLKRLQWLIHRFVDADELLELQCLYAIQHYMAKLEYPSGILVSIITALWEDNIISNETFLIWKNTKDPAEQEGHAVAVVTLTSFFTNLQEADDSSSVEEGSTSVNQDRC